jgi:hypothetical protein
MTSVSKKCLLHIGAPKTGTTALQAFLAENREILMETGWCYPDVNLRGYGHHDLAFLISGGYPDWATPQEKRLDELQEELKIAVENYPNIILSSEDFYLYPKPELTADVLNSAGMPADSVRVIVYIRRQDEAHIAWYNQVVKAQGYAESITGCIDQYHNLWDYYDRLQPWADVFGWKNMVIRSFDRSSLVAGDIKRDFLEIAAVNPDKFHFNDTELNTRINTDLLEFQRRINRLPLTPQEKRRYHKELIELTRVTSGTDLFSDAPLLTAVQRRDILESYKASNARIRKQIGRSILFKTTGDEYNEDEQETVYNGDSLTTDKVVYIFGWLLAKHGMDEK